MLTVRPGSVARALVALAFALGAARAQAFETGFNQAWIGEAYGHDFTTSFDPAAIDRDLAVARRAGASVVRLWLFEGQMKQGVAFATPGTRATGLVPGFLDHVEATCIAARRAGLRIYWTGHDGNWAWPLHTRAADINFNILNDKYGEGQSFRARALGPVLDVLARYPDTVFAYDLMNEVEGSVAKWFWSDGWTGARRFIQAEAAFVHARFPGLAVTASAGWGTAAEDLVAGRFSGLGLDFHDIHLYNDDGVIPKAYQLRDLCWRTGMRLCVGEFGQKTQKVDDALQRKVTARFLAAARDLGCFAALAWRLDDERPDAPSFVPCFSFLRGGAERPAMADVRAFARAHPGASAAAWDYARFRIR
ncbi:MAG TPA: hypothetical protein VHF22_09690 [Planctomycetota bacterium]|nr:hypothetical protein [Planctomycetota bacterium]